MKAKPGPERNFQNGHSCVCTHVVRISQRALWWGVSAPGEGGCLLLGGLLMGGSAPGGGVCLWSQGGVSQHALGQTPPVNRMTDGCKNITLPQTSFAGGKYKERKKERKEELCRKSTPGLN